MRDTMSRARCRRAAEWYVKGRRFLETGSCCLAPSLNAAGILSSIPSSLDLLALLGTMVG